jgi:hypothetical protein
MDIQSILFFFKHNKITNIWVFTKFTLKDILFYVIQLNIFLLCLLVACIIGARNELSNEEKICLDFKSEEMKECSIQKFIIDPYKRGKPLRYLIKTSCSNEINFLPIFTEGFTLNAGDKISKTRNEHLFRVFSEGIETSYEFKNVFPLNKLTNAEKIEGVLRFLFKIYWYALIYGIILYIQISAIKVSHFEK